MRIEKPWGHEIVWAKTDRYVGKVLYIKKGHRLSLQKHLLKDETIMVTNGTLYLTHSNEDGTFSEKRLKPGQHFHVKVGCIHRMAAVTGDVLVMEVSTPELEDVVRLEDDYDRAHPMSGAV